MRFVRDKNILSETKKILSRTKILSMAKKSILTHEKHGEQHFSNGQNFLSWTKKFLSGTKCFCPGQIWFCPRQKLFCPGRRTRHKTLMKLKFDDFEWKYGPLYLVFGENFWLPSETLPQITIFQKLFPPSLLGIKTNNIYPWFLPSSLPL